MQYLDYALYNLIEYILINKKCFLKALLAIFMKVIYNWHNKNNAIKENSQ